MVEDIIKVLEKGDISTALKEAREKHFPENLLAEGIIYYHTGNIEKAKQLLQKYIV